jgi:competence protein ComEA
MLARFTVGQIIIVVACIVLLAALFMGFRLGAEAEDGGEEQVEYTLADGARVPITVHVVGAVQRPGLYELTAGARVRDAIAAAGGLTSRANPASVNLAAFVDDGDQVEVEGAEEAAPEPDPEPRPTAPVVRSSPEQDAAPQPPAAQPRSVPSAPRHSRAEAPSPQRQSPSTRSPQSDLPAFARSPSTRQVRINHAGLDELQTIEGIGPEIAKRIIYHRSIHGPFQSLNELDDVPGIGPATIEHIRVSATLR